MPARPFVRALLLAGLAPLPAAAQTPPMHANSVVSGDYSYADMTDMVLAAPIVALVEIDSAARLKPAEAGPLPPGIARMYVQATVVTLVRGDDGVPPKISYLADVSTDSANHPPKLKKLRMLLLAAAVPGRPGEVRLIAPRAQMPWTAPTEARVRAILAETLAPNALPPITAITGAFHVPGSLPGESETQIFLRTAAARPISLSILRRPGEQPRWAVSLTEMVDNSAAPPKRDTLLWYRLACGLPATLPDKAIAALSAEDQAAAQADYRIVKAGLGPCGRSAG